MPSRRTGSTHYQGLNRILMTFLTNPRRDASQTIAGFVFQVNVTILRWMELHEGEHLELECGEDIDTVKGVHDDGVDAEARLLEQLKVRSGKSITLKSPEALEALSNFCGHRASNPSSNLRFRYVTTANSGFEQGWDLPDSGIETWMGLQSGRYDDSTRKEAIAALRAFLKSCMRPEKVPKELWQALQQVLASDDDADLTEVILRFEWGIGYGDYSQKENQILSALSRDGHVKTAEEANQAYEHLLAFVFRLLCQPGKKVLTINQLATKLQTPSLAQADRAIVQLVRNELAEMALRIDAVETAMTLQANDVTALKQTVGLMDKSLGFNSGFALSALSPSTDLPELVSPCAARDTVIDGLLGRARADGIVALLAEPGSGKTQLLVLTVRRSKRRAHWLNIPRDATEWQACTLIDTFIRSIGEQVDDLRPRESYAAASEKFRGSLVVVEDLPSVLPGGPLARRIEALGRCLKTVDAYLFVSSYYRLPATVEQTLGKIHSGLPRFTTADVAELLAAAEAPENLRTAALCQLLVDVAQGLAALVMAAVRYLADRNWNFTAIEVESLFRGEFASALRQDANSLLRITVPDTEERELLIRMSLAIGAFTMDDIASVARVPKAIRLPGEKVQRATGLWLQHVGGGRYLRSPLITPGVADSLDPLTRKGVYFVLAMRILARKALDPMEALVCVTHLLMAGDTAFAVMVVIRTLTAFLELREPIENDFGFSHLFPLSEPLADVDLSIQIHLRATQIMLLEKKGKDVLSLVETLDALIARVNGTGWVIAISSGALAAHLALRYPALANKYLLQALSSSAGALLPDGSPLPVGDYPLEHILWVSAYACKSDADVDSWLATIRRFAPAQIEKLKTSELMDDNITIFCDGIWQRVYLKPETERDWETVKKKLEEVEGTARVINFPLLEAAAVRTRIMVLAEWEDQLDLAIRLSESTLGRLETEECRFLIMEVTGRQLFYAKMPKEAASWIERALKCDAYHQSLWRRNLLITMAEIYSSHDPRKAAEYTAEAVRISRDGKLISQLYVEALAEHGIALWNTGDQHESFKTFEEATNQIFAARTDTDNWKGQFARLFSVIAYFSGVALDGKPQEGHIKPEQGLFLSSRSEAHTGYRAEQLAYVCNRLAMFADGIKNIPKAAFWTWKAIELAKEIPSARVVVHFLSWRALPEALLSDDFIRAAQLANLMLAANADEMAAANNGATDGRTAGEARSSAPVVASAPIGVRRSSLRITPLLPIAIRLTTLKLQGRSTASTAASLADIESVIRPDLLSENFVTELRRALVDETDWQVLRDEGYRAIGAHEYVRGFVLCIGAADRAPISMSLYQQIYLAENFEKMFQTYRSMYREVVAPFFAAYWKRTITESTGLFCTGLAYTERQLQLADGSAEGTRNLLKAMRFCLGAKFPEHSMKWLEASE
jgi:tetratricopeptide (TPR) repeat protein